LRLIGIAGGFGFGPFLPSLFPFPDPAPPDRLLLDFSFQKKPDFPIGDNQARGSIGVISLSAALAANLTWFGLGGRLSG